MATPIAVHSRTSAVSAGNNELKLGGDSINYVNTDAEVLRRSREAPAEFGELFVRHAGVLHRYGVEVRHATRLAGGCAFVSPQAGQPYVAAGDRRSYRLHCRKESGAHPERYRTRDRDKRSVSR